MATIYQVLSISFFLPALALSPDIVKFCQDALLILLLGLWPSPLHRLQFNVVLLLMRREGMFQLAFRISQQPEKENEGDLNFFVSKKKRDLWQKEEPVEEKAGGGQNGPGGSSGNVPEVAKFNHYLEYVEVICGKYLDTRICRYEEFNI